MNTTRLLAKNLATMLMSQAITWAAAFALLAYFPRMVGAANWGKWQFAYALIGFFAILIDLGTNTLITREVARDRSRAAFYLVNTLALKVAMALVAYAALVGTVLLMKRPPDVVAVVCILGLSMILLTFTDFLNSILQGFEQMHYQAWGNVINRLASTTAILALLFSGHRLVPIACSVAVTNGIGTAWSAYWVLRLVRPRRDLLRLAAIRHIITASAPFLLFALFAQVYTRVDIAMLAMMTNDTVVGWYGAARYLFDTMFFLPYILHTIAFPVLSRLYVSDFSAYRQAVHRGFALLAVTSVAVSVSAAVLADPLIDLLYSRAEFPGAAPALRILAVAMAFMYLNTMLVMILQSSDRQVWWTKAAALAAVVNPVINYLFIPTFGHLGAAVTVVITELLLLSLALCSCPRGLLGWSDLGVVLRAVLGGVVLVCGLLIGLQWGIVGALAVGFPLYAASIWVLGIISPADRVLLRGMVASRLGTIGKIGE